MNKVPSVTWKDLRQQADVGPTVLPKDNYVAVAKSAKVAQTQTGKPMIKVTFNVIVGPHAGSPIYGNFTISEESTVAMGIFFRQMEELGAGKAFFDNEPSVEQIADFVVEQAVPVVLSVDHREHNNLTYLDIKRIQRHAGAGNGNGVAAVAAAPLAPPPAAPLAPPPVAEAAPTPNAPF